MDRLLAPPNGQRFAVVGVALLARTLLGWLPLIGGTIALAMLLVVLVEVALIAASLVRTASRVT